MMRLALFLWLALLPFGVNAQRFVKTFVNIADMIAANPNDVHYQAQLAGYYTMNDGGGGDFIWVAGDGSSTNLGTIFVSTHPSAQPGRWKRLYSKAVDVTWFGAKGDGATDDRASILSALEVASTGLQVDFGKGKTYAVTDTIIIPEKASLELNGSTIRFDLNGDKFALQPRNYTAVSNGKIVVNGSNLVGVGGDWHCPIVIGNLFGAMGNPLVGYNNIVLRNLQVEGNRAGGSGIAICSDSNNVLLDNINFPSSSTMAACIGINAGTDGNNPPLATTHPYNISLKNISCGVMTRNSTVGGEIQALVYISGAHGILVDGAYAQSFAGSAIIVVTPGDYGYTKATPSIQQLAMQAITIRGVLCPDAKKGGMAINGDADNAGVIYKVPILVENSRVVGTGLTSANAGFHCARGYDFTFRNCEASSFQYGFYVDEKTERISFLKCRAFQNNKHGFFTGGGVLPVATVYDGCESWLNMADGVPNSGGIWVGSATDTIVQNCIFGDKTSETNQPYALVIQTDSVRTRVYNNTVRNIKAGGAAYVLGAGGNYYNAVWEFSGNATTAVGTYRSGLINVPVRRKLTNGNAVNTDLVSANSSAPTDGTWVRGDTLTIENPTTGVAWQYICTASGSPGTWSFISPLQVGTNGKLARWTNSPPFIGETVNMSDTGTEIIIGQRFRLTSELVFEPFTQTLGAAAAISTARTVTKIQSTGGAVTLVSTPTIGDSFDGHILWLVGISNTDTITIQDNSTLPGSNIELGAASRTLGLGDVLGIVYDTVHASWYEISYANN